MEQKKLTKKYPLWFRMLIPFLEKRKFPELTEGATKEKWYRITLKDCVGADGAPTYAQFYPGTENKLIVFFGGGGVSINEYTAARPVRLFEKDKDDMFYMLGMDLLRDVVPHKGILSDKVENPFVHWSKLCIQYNTGDFHVGNHDFPYTAKDGNKEILYHHGYKNYRTAMAEVKKMVDCPEDMIVCGCSAGAFGTAMLTDDVMSFYPECQNVVCLVDSALCILKDFPQIAREVWGVPEEIASRLHSENLVLDSMVALAQKHGERVKCLYTSSTRDGALARLQNYIVDGKLVFTKESGERFYHDYGVFSKQLQEQIPDVGIYVFDKIDKSLKDMGLTVHCIIGENFFYEDKIEDTTCVKWIQDALQGKVHSYGLELLSK